MTEIQKQIEEMLKKTESEVLTTRIYARNEIDINGLYWLTHQQSIISQQNQAIERVISEIEKQIELNKSFEKSSEQIENINWHKGRISAFNISKEYLKEMLKT